MSCYKPMHAIMRPSGGRPMVYSFFEHKEPYYDPGTGEYFEEFTIPCGHCLGCLLSRSKQWACRVTMESLDYASNYFVTLTYDDQHLPLGADPQYFDPVSESYKWHEDFDYLNTAVLSKSDYQNFLKRLRIGLERHYGIFQKESPLRLFGAGEYGSRTMRPHYHLCLMNLPLDDLKIYGRNKTGQILYNSPFLDEVWGKGYVVVGELNWQTAAYTARYVMKKATQSKMEYEQLGIPPEFQTQSRRPGLGLHWLDSHEEYLLQFDSVVLPASDRDRITQFRPPRYFDQKLKERYPLEFARIKEKRAEVARIAEANRATQTDLDAFGYFQVAEANAKHKLASLVRYL